MSLLRRAAVRISSGVVRRASPGAKEWAQATAREVEFIESDWTALRWALGSVRILWQRCETPIASAADVPWAALRLAREIRRRTIAGCSSMVLTAVLYSHTVYRMHRPTHLVGAHLAMVVGAYLTLAAFLYMGLQFLAMRGGTSLRGGIPAGVGAYRLELERQRGYYRGAWLWSRVLVMLPGNLLFCVAAAIAYPGIARPMAGIVLVLLTVSVLTVPINQRVARRYQRRIDELDAVERTA